MTTSPRPRYDARGLIPAIVQDEATGRVLMLAWMNREALRLTRKTGEAHYWSRSRRELWRKGATSGHTQRVRSLALDCDRDAVLLRVEQTGSACHRGTFTCFGGGRAVRAAAAGATRALQAHPSSMLAILDHIIEERRRRAPRGSYTTKLLRGALDDLVRKIGEEATELVLASKNRSRRRVVEESCDLLYHLLVLCARRGIRLTDLESELEKRHRPGP
ncbi:MAG: bifunctional phosphoribosyl-AMP cyclohydrolase/phosphoribosyl-ATP diphosphatase HisIE [Planctomycetes bacterium]|nr:bifunctional phosphoribosyl-AMP cyclohydrolase/phosphoribosyl-ATP diphosphatase HisIE [Planctomycetota bacterium]